ncbi:MAG: hypothetical protein ACRENE_02195 [Polyangiaceae bacterium]
MRRVAGFALLVLAALATSALAAEPRRTIDVSRALDAGLPVVSPVGDPSPTPPDPPPLVERRQWVFDLRWDRGDVWLLGTTAQDLEEPQPTPRVMGRFALELFEGDGSLCTLVERVRFDFPMLGPPEGDAGPPGTGVISLQRNLRTRIGVLFPSTKRGTRLELVDRATGRRWSLPWPPASGLPAPTPVPGDAG